MAKQPVFWMGIELPQDDSNPRGVSPPVDHYGVWDDIRSLGWLDLANKIPSFSAEHRRNEFRASMIPRDLLDKLNNKRK